MFHAWAEMADICAQMVLLTTTPCGFGFLTVREPRALEQASFRSCFMWARRLQNIGSVGHRGPCPAACGILPDQGLNCHPLHCRADSQSLAHQECPLIIIINFYLKSRLKGILSETGFEIQRKPGNLLQYACKGRKIQSAKAS